jgi:non-ribosomal peptide synthetase component F
MPLANRAFPGTSRTVGYFANMLPMPLDVAADFGTVVRRAGALVVDALAAQHLPFHAIVEQAVPRRERGREPLVQATFSVQEAPFAPLELAGLTGVYVPADSDTAQFAVMLKVTRFADRYLVSLRHRLIDTGPALAARLLDQVRDRLAAAVAQRDRT